ncbi:3'-5' exonuclease [Solibacillus sp. FSL K6-1554]|uniref:3'-5' exonuclease n=1 Tax=Solibacillus sp. FSL K6-1554 TaxID=2921472 RepID=UPI0030F98B7F
MNIERLHIRIMITCSIVGFAKREALAASYPTEAIDELEQHGYIARTRYGHYYNTKLAAQYLRKFITTYSPRLKVAEMVELLERAPEYVVVDIETTGGSAARGDKIVEIAALKIRHGETVDLFHRFVNPEKPIKNSHIHGITNERVKDEQTIFPVIHAFKAFLGDLPIVSHHIGFDWYSFLALEFFRNGIRPTNPAACTVLLARKYLDSPRNNLNVIAETYNIPLLNHHTADADAICANEILQLIMKKATAQ